MAMAYGPRSFIRSRSLLSSSMLSLSLSLSLLVVAVGAAAFVGRPLERAVVLVQHHHEAGTGTGERD